MTPQERARECIERFWETFPKSCPIAEYIIDAIQAAIAEEREACAQIADEDADVYFGADAFVQAEKAARDVARAIRKRTP